jgi:hypothetical protein
MESVLQVITDSTEALSNLRLYNNIIDNLTNLETAHGVIERELDGTEANVDVSQNEPVMENGENLSEESKEKVLDSAKKGLEADGNLNELFNNNHVNYPQGHPDKDKYETLYSYYCYHSENFSDSCKNKK